MGFHIVPFIVFTVVVICSAMLPGANNGLRLFFVPDWNKLLTTQVGHRTYIYFSS